LQVDVAGHVLVNGLSFGVGVGTPIGAATR
jgi:hypothetical protein